MWILNETILYVKRNIRHKKIIIVGSASLQQKCEKISDICFMDEDKMLEGLSFQTVKQAVKHRNLHAVKRTGWYFQQFLKLGYARVCDEEEYLVWDADTIPLKRLAMSRRDGRLFFDVKSEYHLPYFKTIQTLLPDLRIRETGFSFISEHMVLRKEIVLSLLNKIEENDNIPGQIYWEKIINAIERSELPRSGFSEFETYGQFVLNFYKDEYLIRRIPALRNGELYLRKDFTEADLKWAAKSFDIISFEGRGKFYKYEFLWNGKLRKIISLKTVVWLDEMFFPSHKLIKDVRRVKR
ncbi:MAG: hypothetical protein K2L07_16310 [Lachnospiraceae bacterium]|nr:hypothetical protein [Lachnospiraceae bacterium]